MRWLKRETVDTCCQAESLKSALHQSIFCRLKSQYGNVAAQFAFCGNKGKSVVHLHAHVHPFAFHTWRRSAASPSALHQPGPTRYIGSVQILTLRQFVSLCTTPSPKNPFSLCLNSWLSLPSDSFPPLAGPLTPTTPSPLLSNLTVFIH